jgi:nucleotide-binding universal stress UspA family protein
LDIAQKSKGVVHLVNVIELPAIHDPILMPVVMFEKEFIKELRDKATAEFEKIINRYNSQRITVKTDVLFGGPAKMIMDAVKKKSIDLIIMGSHGATGFREYFIGSNAEKIVRNSRVPVLVLKNYYKGTIKSIVFPNTLETEKQDDLIRKVKDLQAFFKATVHIVYVNTPTNFMPDNYTFERLKQFAKEFQFKKFTLNVYNYPFEESGVIHFTSEIKGDMIAMGTHGRKGLAHFLNGSLAEDVVNHTNSPIWTYVSK